MFFVWLSLDWVIMLLGTGVNYNELITAYVSADNAFTYAVLMKTGLFGASLFLAGIWVACYKPLTIIKKTKNRIIHNWSRLSVLFSIYSVLFLVSTVHYYQAIENPGVYPLFSLIISLSIYCKHKWIQI